MRQLRALTPELQRTVFAVDADPRAGQRVVLRTRPRAEAGSEAVTGPRSCRAHPTVYVAVGVGQGVAPLLKLLFTHVLRLLELDVQAQIVYLGKVRVATCM